MQRFAGRTAVVTGASRGIGRATALRLAGAGHTVFVSARRPEALAATPDDVARRIEKAVAARRPRARYGLIFGATLLLGLRRWLGDRGLDAFLRTRFPTPVAR